MGRVGRTILDFLRAGALATGTAFLLGLWFQGLARLNIRRSYPDGLPDFLIVTAAGIALGSTLGFPVPAARWPHVLGRVAGTFVAAIAVAAALGLGVPAFLVWKLDVAEHDLPYYFLPVGAALVAVGLRRLPRTRAARIALGAPVALLVIMRLLAQWPTGAHAITRRIFPLTPAVLRAAVDQRHWGPLALDGRTRLVALESTPSYHTEGKYLAADAALKFTLEVTQPFFEDGCGDLHTSKPEPPAWVHNYPDLDACLEEHPHRDDEMYEMRHHHPSACCLFQLRERHPGEQIHAKATWPFVFARLSWLPQN